MDYEAFLQEFYALKRFGIKLGLDVIAELLHRMLDPHRRFATVHVAGTNGKGSVTAFLSSILREAGYHTGAYTSPHLVRFNERIAVNGWPIRDDDVMRIYYEIKPHMDAMAAISPTKQPTFFEVSTAMAFQHFADSKADIAVVEAGLGGRHDATSVLEPEVSVLTRIDLDHTDHLGRSVTRIAREKSGIIKTGRPVATLEQPGLEEIESRCRVTGSPLLVVGRDIQFERRPTASGSQRVRFEDGERGLEVEVPLRGAHQAENAAIAYAAVKQLRERDWTITNDHVRRGFANARLRGRMETLHEKPLVLVDGGHNPSASRAVAAALPEIVGDRKVTLVFGVMGDKDLGAMVDALRPITRRVVTVRSESRRGRDAEEVAAAFHGLEVEVIPDVGQALRKTIEDAAEDEVVLVTGSLIVAGEALAALED
jgi:dihydrofolate synthase/folylpolyglutamate synthase